MLSNKHLSLTCENPFSASRVRPGAIPFIFPSSESLVTLLERLERNNWRGEIVGPHGSGKSTLLATLLPAMEECGRKVVLLKLHDYARCLPPLPEINTPQPVVLAVDGFEQLPLWRRCWLKHVSWYRGWGLVATSHRSVGLPLLYQTNPNLELAQAIIRYLLTSAGWEISSEEVALAFARCDGNLREMLFALYDLYEHRRRS